MLVADVQEGLKTCDQELLELFRAKGIPYLIAWNKSDLLKEIPEAGTGNLRKRTGTVSDLGAERENCPSGAGFRRTESAGA